MVNKCLIAVFLMANFALAFSSSAEKKVNDGPLCIICTNVVNTIEALTKDNQTTTDIMKVLDLTCYAYGPLYQACRSFVDKNVPQIINYLAQNLNATEICGLVGACATTSVQVKPKQADGPACIICESVVGTIHTLTSDNKTKQDIVKIMDLYCFAFGPLYNQCKSYVDQHIPEILNYLSQNLNATQICGLIGACPSTNVQLKVKVGDNPLCPLCTQIITEVKTLLENNQTQDDIIKIMDLYCLAFGPLYTSCKTFVNQHVPEVIYFIEKNANPSQICQFLTACDKNQTVVSTKKLSDGPLCIVCESVVNTVKSLSSDNKTEADILKVMDLYCLAFGPLYNQCRTLVDTHVPQILNYLNQNLNATQICGLIGACSSTNVQVKKVKTNGPACIICESVVGTIQSLTADNKTQDDIVKIMDLYCFAFGPLYNTCRSYVDQHIPQILNYLAQNLNASQICGLIGACDSEKQTLELKKEMETLQCLVCHDVVNYTQSMLKNNQTDTEIISTLGNYCSILGSFSNICQKFIQTNVPVIIQALENELDSTLICQKIKLCPAQSLKPFNKFYNQVQTNLRFKKF